MPPLTSRAASRPSLRPRRRVSRRAGDAGVTAPEAPPAAAAPPTPSALRATAVSAPPAASIPGPADELAVRGGYAPTPARHAAAVAGGLLHVIPRSRWPDGVPAVMGAHLMASHAVAPISVSKGAGVVVGGGGDARLRGGAAAGAAGVAAESDVWHRASAAGAAGAKEARAGRWSRPPRRHQASAGAGAADALPPAPTPPGPGIDVTPHPFQYPAGEGDPDAAVGVRVFSSPAGAAAAAARELLDASAASIAARGHFAVALSGGSALDALAPLLVAAKGSGTDFSKWLFSFADDRVVPRSSPDSTYGAAKTALFAKLGVDEAAQVVGLQEGLSAENAAAAFFGALLALPRSTLPIDAAGLPVFDAVVLGVGPDGHVASLFPNAATLAAAAATPWALPVLASPKPPAERVTLTMPAINAAARVLLVATGPGKAAAVARALETQALPGAVPAQLVRPGAGEATWFLDGDSASLLSVADWGDSKKFPRSA